MPCFAYSRLGSGDLLGFWCIGRGVRLEPLPERIHGEHLSLLFWCVDTSDIAQIEERAIFLLLRIVEKVDPPFALGLDEAGRCNRDATAFSEIDVIDTHLLCLTSEMSHAHPERGRGF